MTPPSLLKAEPAELFVIVLFKNIFKKFEITCMCPVSLLGCLHVGCLWRSQEGILFSRTGRAGGCELPDIDTGR